MQSRAPEGRSIVSISPNGAISIDPAAGSLQQAGTARGSQPTAAIGNVLTQITDAFQGLFNSAGHAGALSQGPSLFSATGSSSSDSLAALRGTLDDLSKQLSALLTAPSTGTTPEPAPPPVSPFASPVHSTPTPAAATSKPQVNPDWPYPDLGPKPFMDSPTGSGPGGTFNFNPTYFASESTAQAIANMMGGKVVTQNAVLNAPGSPFMQNQPNYMVELPSGKTINPGVIAQAISNKQARTMVDAVIYAEVNDCLITPGSAPVFVPVNPPLTSSSAPVSSPVLTPAAGASSEWSSLDQLAAHAPRSLQASQSNSDPDTSAINQQMQAILKMFQLLVRLVSVQQSMQQNTQGRRSVSL